MTTTCDISEFNRLKDQNQSQLILIIILIMMLSILLFIQAYKQLKKSKKAPLYC